jgi:GT2 family glycosyltransferase
MMGISERRRQLAPPGPDGPAAAHEGRAPRDEQLPQGTPLLSIIVLTLDSEEFIRECLGSLPPLNHRTEVLVVDGGSRDATVAFVRRTFPWVRLHIAPGTGIPRARNVGLRLASGRYVLFLDSDDRLRGNALESVLQCLEDNAPAFAVTHWTRINRAGEPLGARAAGYPDPYGGLLSNPVATIGMVCRRDLLLTLGGFSEAFPVAEDYDMWLRLFEVAQGHRLEIFLGDHRIRKDSASQADHLRMRIYGTRAALAAARRRQAPWQVRVLLTGHWSLAILGDLGLIPPAGVRALERVGRFGDKLHTQLEGMG